MFVGAILEVVPTDLATRIGMWISSSKEAFCVGFDRSIFETCAYPGPAPADLPADTVASRRTLSGVPIKRLLRSWRVKAGSHAFVARIRDRLLELRRTMKFGHACFRACSSSCEYLIDEPNFVLPGLVQENPQRSCLSLPSPSQSKV